MCARRPGPAADGDILRGRGLLLPDGGISRVRGPNSCPQQRRMPRPEQTAPGRVECPQPHSTGRGLLADPPPVRETLGVWERWRAVAETAPTAGPMSKSDTKGSAGVKRAKRNRMIPRFSCSPEEREASFVSDLDTTRSASQDLSGDTGGNSDASDASSPPVRRDPTVGAHEARTRCDGANPAAALGCPHAPPRCRSPPHRSQALRPA